MTRAAARPTASSAVDTVNQSFGWMCVGLIVTAFAALFISSSATLIDTIYSNSLVFFGLMILELIIVWVLSSRVLSMSYEEAVAAFLIYSFINGVTLSSIFLVYTSTSVVSAFFITAAVFGCMTVYGYVTKRDLTSVGSLAFMALIGLIVASVVNLFLNNSAFGYILSYLSILIFIGLTAYDAQKIKQMGEYSESRNLGILGALTLYLDFINIFLDVLRLFGSERKA